MRVTIDRKVRDGKEEKTFRIGPKVGLETRPLNSFVAGEDGVKPTAHFSLNKIILCTLFVLDRSHLTRIN